MNGLFDPRREHDACGVGFVAYLDGQSRHDVMHMALGAMTRMAHRGGGDGKNGDGAGILFPLPRDFFLRQWPALSVCAAPWAVAQLFLPQDTALRALCLQRFREIFTACAWKTSVTSLCAKTCWLPLPVRPCPAFCSCSSCRIPAPPKPPSSMIPKPLNAACSLPGTWPRT